MWYMERGGTDTSMSHKQVPRIFCPRVPPFHGQGGLTQSDAMDDAAQDTVETTADSGGSARFVNLLHVHSWRYIAVVIYL